MDVNKEPEEGKKYGKTGCIIGIVILVIIIIAIATGLINIPGSDGSVTG